MITKKPTVEYHDKNENKSHKVYRFPNGWGASLAQGPGCRGGRTPGCWSLAVIFWESAGDHLENFEIHYHNPLAQGDVICELPEDQVDAYLTVIENFPRYGTTFDAS